MDVLAALSSLRSTPLSNDPMSEDTIAQIDHWLEDCTHSHPACSSIRPKRTASFLTRSPTRLLDLHDSQSKTWNLVLTYGPPARYPYVALTHRWTVTVPKLKEENLGQLQTGQPDDILPINYRQIISLCRALSIRYLWIDSLCILQDSIPDFHREAATMVNVYAGALFTMSICWSSKSGCLPVRDPSRMIPKVLFRKSNGDQGGVALLGNYFRFDEDVSNAPINERGWVFQERVLSPRILYLTKEQYYWECDALVACEVYPGGMPSRFPGQQIGVSGQRIDVTDNDSCNVTSRIWMNVVEEYTKSSLTFQRDMFIALSGVARQVASMNSDKYLAGLWKSRLPFDLFWEPSTKRQLPQKDCYAPSWSWASTLGCISMTKCFCWPDFNTLSFTAFALPYVKPLALVGDTSVLPQGSNEFGDISSASIDFKCLVIPVDIEKINISGFPKGAVQIDFQYVPRNQRQLKLDRSAVSFAASFRSISLDCQHNARTSCFFLPLVYNTRLRSSQNPSIEGLIIKSQLYVDPRLETYSKEEFIRIGLFKIEGLIIHKGVDNYVQLDTLILNTFLQVVPEHQQCAEMKDNHEKSEQDEQHLVFESRLRALMQLAKADKSWTQTEDYLDARWSDIRLV